MKISPAALYTGYRALIRNPQTRWLVVLGTVLYLFSPLDLAPDLLPLAGQLDDVLLVTLLLTELFQISRLENASAPEESGSGSPQAGANPAAGFGGRSPFRSPFRSPASPSPTEKTVDVDAVSVED